MPITIVCHNLIRVSKFSFSCVIGCDGEKSRNGGGWVSLNLYKHFLMAMIKPEFCSYY